MDFVFSPYELDILDDIMPESKKREKEKREREIEEVSFTYELDILDDIMPESKKREKEERETKEKKEEVWLPAYELQSWVKKEDKHEQNWIEK